MNEESNVGPNILLLNVKRCQEEINIVDPDHVFFTLDLQQTLHENLVNVAVRVPHICIPRIDIILVNSFEIVKERPHKLLAKHYVFLDLTFV